MNFLCDFLSFEPQHDIVFDEFQIWPPEGGHVLTFGGYPAGCLNYMQWANKLHGATKNSTKVIQKWSLCSLVIIDQNNILTILIHNLKTTWSTKIPMPFLSSLDNLLYDAYTTLQTNVWQFWDRAQNMLIFG